MSQKIEDKADVAEAERETSRIRYQMNGNSTVIDVNALRRKLKILVEKNLDEATFEDKRDTMNKLDIRAYPSEDLKTAKIKCGLSLDIEDKNEIADVDGCRIVVSGLPKLKGLPYRGVLKRIRVSRH